MARDLKGQAVSRRRANIVCKGTLQHMQRRLLNAVLGHLADMIHFPSELTPELAILWAAEIRKILLKLLFQPCMKL